MTSENSESLFTTDAPAGTPCTDDDCNHDGHCGFAHTRKAHRLQNLITGGKLDAGMLVVAVCSCGNYRSAPGLVSRAKRAHGHHQAANLGKLAKELPCVHCPPEVHDAIAARRALLADTDAQP